jgi:hypothetical protein
MWFRAPCGVGCSVRVGPWCQAAGTCCRGLHWFLLSVGSVLFPAVAVWIFVLLWQGVAVVLPLWSNDLGLLWSNDLVLPLWLDDWIRNFVSPVLLWWLGVLVCDDCDRDIVTS